MTLRHDAAECRAKARSELTRRSLGIETPQEREAREKAESKATEKRAKEEAKGQPLGLEE